MQMTQKNNASRHFYRFALTQKRLQSTLEIGALDLTVSIFGPKELEILIFTLDLAVLSK